MGEAIKTDIVKFGAFIGQVRYQFVSFVGPGILFFAGQQAWPHGRHTLGMECKWVLPARI